MISISFVEWCTGFKNDLKKLAGIAHKRGIPLVVDGAQGVGALSLDVIDTGIDALACPTWKWLWGPLGLGFLYMKPEFMEQITPPFVGADGVAPTGDILDFQLRPADGMKRFEYSTKNYCDIIVFDKSLELTLELGITAIEEALLKLTTDFMNEVEKAGYRIFGNYPRENRSGIFSFMVEKCTPEELLLKMRENGILANVRDGRLRIAPHVYSGREDAQHFGETLRTITASLNY